MRAKQHIFLILSLAVLAGCAGTAPSLRHTAPFPSTLALLPLENQSLDLRAPELLRELLDTYLSAAGFNLTDVREVDEKLRGIGISEGGQLNAVTPQKLAGLLEADALLYGDIETFNYSNIGVYAGRTVKMRLWLVDAKTGATLWETEKSKANSQLGLSKAAAKDIFVKGYA
ncbi:MAG: GNA1162 family protein, partial [Elusimicrobiota bacterium]